MSAAEVDLVQLCEHSSRLDGLDKDLAAHLLDDQKHSKETLIPALTSLQAAKKQSHHYDDSALDMSLVSDLLSSKSQSQFAQELHHATKIATKHTREAVDKLQQEFDQATIQST